MKKLILFAALALAGCATKPVIPDINKALLEPCQLTPELKGMKGADVIKWARQAGPIITHCYRTHNALVEVLKPLQRD